MAKTLKEHHEKTPRYFTCEKCGEFIKPLGIMTKGKIRSAKECGCGIFIGNKKFE